MASRPRGFGMTAELNEKKNAKYDVALEREARAWMERVLTRSISDNETSGMPEGQDRLHAELKSGVTLCHLINAIHPNSVKKINDSKMAFKMMENIGAFLDACEDLGVNRLDLFQTVDLYEKQNMAQVVNGIFAVGRKAQTIGYEGPVLGPKESAENRREFTDEQLRAGSNVIGLQMGSNKGDSQAGMSFGKARHIVD